MNDHGDGRPVLEAMARPAGSGAQHLDQALFGEIDAMLADGRAATPEEAALALAVAGRVWGQGGSEPQNRARRLARRYREFRCSRIPGQGEGESASLRAMSAAPTIAHDAASAARFAALEARCAELEAYAAQREVEVMHLTETVTELIAEASEIRPALERLADAFEGLANTSEARLDLLGAPAVVSAVRN